MIDKQTEQAMRHWTLAQPAVAAFVASQIHNVRQRDDILQEVAVAILQNYERFDPALIAFCSNSSTSQHCQKITFITQRITGLNGKSSMNTSNARHLISSKRKTITPRRDTRS